MELICGDAKPNSPQHPTTPLEQMDEDDMRRLHPTLPSNADLLAMDQRRTIHIQIVVRTPFCIELLLWTLLQTDTTTICCTEHY